MTFELAPVDGLNDDELKEMANLFAAKCQKAAQQTVKDAAIAGNALITMRERVAPGKWMSWVRENFDYDHRTATTYMTLASNWKRFQFENPLSIRAALKAIAEEKAEESEAEKPITPRAERVTGRVAVSEPDELSGNPGQFDHSADANKKVDENAVPAEPKTNTKHSKATAKAKEADRPVPAVVTPEIVDEPAKFEVTLLSDFSVAEMIDYLKASADDPKKRARELRKAADELDPPAIGAPSIEAVEAWATENRLPDFDANKFFNHYELAGWKYGKAKTPIKDWKRAAANAYAGGKGWAVDGANRLPF